MRVCVLERGKALPAGLVRAQPLRRWRRNFWDPSEGLYGMFDVWSFDGHRRARVERPGRRLADLRQRAAAQGRAVVRRSEDARRGGLRVLAGHAGRTSSRTTTGSRRCSAPQRTRSSTSRTPATPKTRAFARRGRGARPASGSAPTAGRRRSRTTATTPVPGEPIREAHPNLHGRTRLTCRLCGECDIGCNYGSKNTLDYNYLTEAPAPGAEIRDALRGARVRARSPGGGYRSCATSTTTATLDGEPTRHPRRHAPARARDRRRARAVGGHARHDVPAAAQPRRRARASAGAGHPLLRQRRPAHASPHGARRTRTASGRRGRSTRPSAR